MDKIQFPLTQEQCDKIVNLYNKEEQEEYLETILPAKIIFGNGFYGLNNVWGKDGKYFADIWIGSTCD